MRDIVRFEIKVLRRSSLKVWEKWPETYEFGRQICFKSPSEHTIFISHKFWTVYQTITVSTVLLSSKYGAIHNVWASRERFQSIPVR